MEITIDGILYHADIIGEGFPLLLLHGFTGDSTTWKPFLSSWSKNHKVIALDIVGHGKSASPTDVQRYDIVSVSKDIKKILEHLNINKTNVLGYSMGGRLALSFSILYPEFLHKLILESASPGLATDQERENRRIQDEKLSCFILNQGLERFIDYWENIPLFSTQKKLPIHKQHEIKQQRLQNSITGLSNSLLGMGTGAQPSWWDRIQELETETLLLTGKHDQKFCLIAEKMVKKMKHVKWKNIEDCGHAIHVEQPEKFGTIVNGFLSR
ncbi:2-succinyl-6-hydroxy-2,4-cyclohexadiene-1-carboxylate synthase [Niallia endozanthoxylica]|uniref:Putative 2-succinyl-6-hydroxy-2,4-cyclohexadiene-1-carboxylate synthase n=1 Tax=Niallia endozanthoxylica TaxID=2036016 RepID=A0A5J5GW21_9BACI|nr:2-succinyl-6-hydroxy-2,4-cyclohexadiene-1-carboxylate synthase [Niallia endozanthoxylica]KAA9012669.1 2-succinyl-6-hydroxy-2,4-cyclohexadiene-1-carboxylate synthase [Niallia endozanthoxylica]